MSGRYIHHGEMTSAEGLSVDETLAEFAGHGESPPTLHLYHYEPCVILGRYQNAAASLRLDRCEALGIAVNRRATGGGTVFMGPDQMALGLAIPENWPGLPRSIQGAFEFLAAVLARALGRWGLEAEFMGKNDLTVQGRKIAGLAISHDTPGSVFFHTSLLLDFDIEAMLDILNLPTARMLDRGISCFGERMTTLRRELGAPPAMLDVQREVHAALEEILGVSFAPGELSEAELTHARDLRERQYENDSWIYTQRAPKRRMGFAERRTSGGLLQAHICLAGNAIETLLLTGDYFSRTREIARIESVLRWTSAERPALEKRLAEACSPELIHRVDPGILLDLIEEAARNDQSAP